MRTRADRDKTGLVSGEVSIRSAPDINMYMFSFRSSSISSQVYPACGKKLLEKEPAGKPSAALCVVTLGNG